MRMKQWIKAFLFRNPRKSHYKFILRDWIPLLDLPSCAQVLETKRFTRNFLPLPMDGPEAKRILVIAPHPDDDVFGPGGTLIRAASQGAEIQTVYVTDGGNNESHSLQIREELQSACRLIGAAPLFLGIPPGRIPLWGDSRLRTLRSHLDEFRPDCLFIPFFLDDHDDHRRVNEMVVSVLDDMKQSPTEIWAYQVYSTVLPNVVVDITNVLDQKKQAMDLLQSVRGERNWSHYVLGMNAANCRYLPGKEPRYVETFFVVPWVEYRELCRLYFSAGKENVYYKDFYRTQ